MTCNALRVAQLRSGCAAWRAQPEALLAFAELVVDEPDQRIDAELHVIDPGKAAIGFENTFALLMRREQAERLAIIVQRSEDLPTNQ